MKRYLPVIESSGLSDIGPVREENQDAIHLDRRERSRAKGLLFALADGMGGYSNGAVASALALKSFEEAIQIAGNSDVNALRRGVEKANLSVYATAQQLGSGHMGTTLTAAYIVGNLLYLAHVGDSRAYLVRAGRAACLTNDHTRAGELAQTRLISPDRIRSHAQRSVLTRALGLAMFVQPDITQTRLQEQDWLILCSDGVWAVIEDDEFASLAAAAVDPAGLGLSLLNLALERLTDDNVSVVTLHVRGFEVIEEVDARPRKSGLGNLIGRIWPEK